MKKFSLKKCLKSFRYAFAGLVELFREENNAKVHALAAVLVIAVGFLLRVSAAEWVALVFAIGLVFAAECFNSSIERLCDVVQPEQDPRIKATKDLAAGAVLACAVAAAVIGLIIFVPKIVALF